MQQVFLIEQRDLDILRSGKTLDVTLPGGLIWRIGWADAFGGHAVNGHRAPARGPEIAEEEATPPRKRRARSRGRKRTRVAPAARSAGGRKRAPYRNEEQRAAFLSRLSKGMDYREAKAIADEAGVEYRQLRRWWLEKHGKPFMPTYICDVCKPQRTFETAQEYTGHNRMNH